MHVTAVGRVVCRIKLVLLPRMQSLPSCLKKLVQCKVMVIRPQRQEWLEKNMSTLALRGGAPNLFAMRVVSADFAELAFDFGSGVGQRRQCNSRICLQKPAGLVHRVVRLKRWGGMDQLEEVTRHACVVLDAQERMNT